MKTVLYVIASLFIVIQLAFNASHNALPVQMDCGEYAEQVFYCSGSVDDAVDAFEYCMENHGDVIPPCPL